MDDSGNVTKDGQQNVDEEVGAAATLEEYTERRQDNGDDDLDDVAATLLSARVVAVCFAGPRRKRETYDPVKAMLSVGWSSKLEVLYVDVEEKCGLNVGIVEEGRRLLCT